MFNRLVIIAARILALITLSFVHLPAHAAPLEIAVKKTATCGCCNAWVDRLKAAGFTVKTENLAMGDLMQFKLKNGIKGEQAACHTGIIAGYLVEGHVPIREIKRLILERPDAIGIAVPGMPMGSPGMDFGPQREPYDVLLIRKNGATEVFAHYTGKE